MYSNNTVWNSTIMMRGRLFYAFLVQRYALQTTLKVVYAFFKPFYNISIFILITGIVKAYFHKNNYSQISKCVIFIIIVRIYIYYAFLVQRYDLQSTLNIVYTFQALL